MEEESFCVAVFPPFDQPDEMALYFINKGVQLKKLDLYTNYFVIHFSTLSEAAKFKDFVDGSYANMIQLHGYLSIPTPQFSTREDMLQQIEIMQQYMPYWMNQLDLLTQNNQALIEASKLYSLPQNAPSFQSNQCDYSDYSGYSDSDYYYEEEEEEEEEDIQVAEPDAPQNQPPTSEISEINDNSTQIYQNQTTNKDTEKTDKQPTPTPTIHESDNNKSSANPPQQNQTTPLTPQPQQKQITPLTPQPQQKQTIPLTPQPQQKQITPLTPQPQQKQTTPLTPQQNSYKFTVPQKQSITTNTQFSTSAGKSAFSQATSQQNTPKQTNTFATNTPANNQSPTQDNNSSTKPDVIKQPSVTNPSPEPKAMTQHKPNQSRRHFTFSPLAHAGGCKTPLIIYTEEQLTSLAKTVPAN